VNSWSGGFQGQVTVTAGKAAIHGWIVRWTLASGQTISQLWNGTLTVAGSSVTVVNLSWNGSLAAGANTTFGFTANGAPTNPGLTCAAS
jgi:cellulase/cellobiase CelA1